MEDITLHKVNFTPEAVHDYEFDLFDCNEVFDERDTDWNEPCIWETPLVHFHKIRTELKHELEEYIQHHSTITRKHYFRITNYDEQSGMWLMFFIKRGPKIGIMQLWDVVGIIDAQWWNEDDEEEGVYREWYGFKFANHTIDWIVVWRLEDKIKAIKTELEEVYEREYEQRFQRDVARRFGSKGAARISAKLAQTKCTRKRLESELRVYEERLRNVTGAS